MDTQSIFETLTQIKSEMDSIYGKDTFDKWYNGAKPRIKVLLGADSELYKEFCNLYPHAPTQIFRTTMSGQLQGKAPSIKEALNHSIKELGSILDEKITELSFTLYQESSICQGSNSDEANDNSSRDSIEIVKEICEKFDVIARRLITRRKDRPALTMDDEYDVQYLLQALLLLHFSDVRAEECTPSFAGAASRMDFLLKDDAISIEVKRPRNGLKDTELRNQLIVDIEAYQAHPSCQHLICFAYDPEHLIKNPRAIENDLSRHHDNIDVSVLIRP